MTTLTPGETQSLVLFFALIAILAALELGLLYVLIALHRRRHPARFWAFMEAVWERILRGTAAALTTFFGAVLIALCFLSALTPAGRRRQAEAEAHIARKRAEERDAFIHHPNSRSYQGRSYTGGNW